MNKSAWLAGALLSLAAMPALPEGGLDSFFDEPGTYPDFTRYRPFHLQLFGGLTLTQGQIERDLENGWNAGLGLTWYPTSHLPLGIRVDGLYNQLSGRGSLLQRASTRFNTPVNESTTRIWGADADLEIDLGHGPYVRPYLLVGVGWYNEQDTYRQVTTVSGTECDPLGCGPGSQRQSSIVARDTTGVHFAKNAGLGVELGMGTGSLFIEARYLRINPSARRADFIPIRFGLRF